MYIEIKTCYVSLMIAQLQVCSHINRYKTKQHVTEVFRLLVKIKNSKHRVHLLNHKLDISPTSELSYMTNLISRS